MSLYLNCIYWFKQTHTKCYKYNSIYKIKWIKLNNINVYMLIFEFYINKLNNVYVNSNLKLNKLYRILFFISTIRSTPINQHNNVPNVQPLGLLHEEYLNKLFFLLLYYSITFLIQSRYLQSMMVIQLLHH